MRYKDSVEEIIVIERIENNLTYKEIADKLNITIEEVKKVLHDKQKGKRPGRRKSTRN